jgi:hypothetical protein
MVRLNPGRDARNVAIGVVGPEIARIAKALVCEMRGSAQSPMARVLAQSRSRRAKQAIAAAGLGTRTGCIPFVLPSASALCWPG